MAYTDYPVPPCITEKSGVLRLSSNTLYNNKEWCTDYPVTPYTTASSGVNRLSSNTLYNSKEWSTKKSAIKQINRDNATNLSEGASAAVTITETQNTAVSPQTLLCVMWYNKTTRVWSDLFWYPWTQPIFSLGSPHWQHCQPNSLRNLLWRRKVAGHKRVHWTDIFIWMKKSRYLTCHGMWQPHRVYW